MVRSDADLAATDRISAGGRISASVESARGRYRTLVRHDEGAALGSECSCPARAGCRHARFLWSTWRQAPRSFLDLKDVEATLAALRGEELRVVVARALRLRPELARTVSVLAQGVLLWERPGEGVPPGSERTVEAAP